MTPQALQWVERFERHLATERRLSPHTLAAYAREVAALCLWCEGERLQEWQQLDHEHIRRFAARSHARGLQGRSVQRRLAALRTFFGFLLREGALRLNPALDVRAPKSSKRLPPALDVDQMAQLLAAKPKDALECRDLALMELFYSAGLRLSELTGLQLRDLDLRQAQVRVLGKGNRTAYRARRAAWRVMALRRWLETASQSRQLRAAALFVGPPWRAPWDRAPCSCGSRRARVPPGCRSTCIRTCFAIPLPRICLNPAAIFAGYRKCSVTPTSARPRSTRTLISSIWPAHTIRPTRVPNAADDHPWIKHSILHSTTILAVRRSGAVVLGGDGQVTLGTTVMKGNARKVRRLSNGKVLAGFAGGTADAFTLFERFEGKLEKYGNLTRAAIELAKDWRSDRYLRRLEALLLVGDPQNLFIISGNGDVIEPEYAAWRPSAPVDLTPRPQRAHWSRVHELDARTIVERALGIAAESASTPTATS